MKRILSGAALALLLGGCGEGPTGPAVVERFELVRLNGLPLPYVSAQSGSTKEEVTAGEIRLFADGSFNDRMTFRTTQGSIVSSFEQTLAGPYSVSGQTYTFTVISDEDPSGNDTYTGTLISDTLVVAVGPSVWKYVER